MAQALLRRLLPCTPAHHLRESSRHLTVTSGGHLTVTSGGHLTVTSGGHLTVTSGGHLTVTSRWCDGDRRRRRRGGGRSAAMFESPPRDVFEAGLPRPEDHI